jgi:hypothetical protein
MILMGSERIRITIAMYHTRGREEHVLTSQRCLPLPLPIAIPHGNHELYIPSSHSPPSFFGLRSQQFYSIFELLFCTFLVSLRLHLVCLASLSQLPLLETSSIDGTSITYIAYGISSRNKEIPPRRQMNGCGPLDPALMRMMSTLVHYTPRSF